MTEQNNNIIEETLVGNWQKVTTDDCADQYPSRMTFVSGGIYTVPNELIQADPMPIWQSGDFELRDDNQITIQTANDAMVIYTIHIENNHLVIVDQNTCTIRYERQ